MSENGPANCIIDCEDNGRGFDFNNTSQNSTDVIDGFVSVIERNDLKGEEFILGGVNIKFGDWINLISEITGNKKKPRHFPMSLAIFYGLICEIKTKITKKPHHRVAFMLGFYEAMIVSEIVNLHQQVIVKVLEVDIARKRIQLSMNYK